MHHAILFVLLLSTFTAHAGDGTLRVHYADAAPPFLFMAPGSDKPTGIVAELLDTAARASHRTLSYDYQPRDDASVTLTNGSADIALFYSATQPAPRDAVLTSSLLRADVLLVRLKEKRIDFSRAADLADQRLCTLTDRAYPPLMLLDMSGKLLQRKAKTEQAQILMLRNEDCVAAVMSAPTLRWLASRYHWDDLRTEKQPLLGEDVVLGVSVRERGFADALNTVLAKWRTSGELDRVVERYLPDNANVSAR